MYVHSNVGKSSVIIDIFNAECGQIVQYSRLGRASPSAYLHLIFQAEVLNSIVPTVTAGNIFIISILLYPSPSI